MTMLDFPEFKEVEGTLNERRKTLHDIFTEAGPEMDMAKVKSIQGDSAAKVEAIRAINDEIDTLATKAEELGVLAKAAAYGDDYREPGDDTSEESGDGHQARRQKSVGELFAESDARTTKETPFELDVDLKTTMTTAAGWAPDNVRGPRLVDFATRPLELLDLIPTTTTNQAAVSYMEETTLTPAAIEVAEGSAKPEAAIALTERVETVRKIAVFLPVTDEQLEDVERIKQYLDNRLGFFVRQRLELQLLVGDGTAPNLSGVMDRVGIQTQAKGADPTPDAVYKAMVLIMTTGQATPDAVVFNPLDWQDVRLLRTADGIYIWGSPSEAGPNRIWGLPVILAQAMTQNTALVGAWKVFSELAVRKGLTVQTGYNASDWTTNKQTIRAEMRAAFLVYRPAAFCSVTGV